MLISIRRFRLAADGQWDVLKSIELTRVPPLADQIAAKRDTGPLAPTDDEIIEACRQTYRRIAFPGHPNAGDIDIEVSIRRLSGA